MDFLGDLDGKESACNAGDICVYTYVYVGICVSCFYMSVCVCVHACMCVYMCLYLCLCMSLCVYMSVYVHVYIKSPILYEWPGSFLIFCHIPWHVGSSFLNQGSNPHTLMWKHRVLTTGPPGKSQPD